MDDNTVAAAPEARRCEFGAKVDDAPGLGGSCGAGQPLYTQGGLVFCEHHADWPNTDSGKELIMIRAMRNKGA